MQMECEGNGASELPSTSNALRTMTEKQLELMVLNMVQRLMQSMFITTIQPMVISTVQQEMQNLLRRGVKEERNAAEEKLSTDGSRKDMPNERSLQLKFLNEVSGPVQTGKELKGTNDDFLKVALVDAAGQIVTCGPESSAKVEILLLDANDENSLNHENFERQIIGEKDKKKPHFAKNVYVCLEKGVVGLTGLKLSHGKEWTKFCNCRLGVRIAQSIRGVVVEEAWTAPFKVIDKRARQYGKHEKPLLSSDVWRLKKIARDGEPCKRLKAKNIKTVQDFRFWLSVDSDGLKQILDADGLWKTTVAHSLTCMIDDANLYLYKSSTQPQLSVVYNSVGEAKGVIEERNIFPIGNLSPEKKDHARELLKEVLKDSAFEQRYETVFNNEAPDVPYQTTEQGSSSQSIMNPSNSYDPDDFITKILNCPPPPSPNPMFEYLDYDTQSWS